jgi:hypothetical protein
MAEVDPDQAAAPRRLWAAFGFVEVLRIIDHELDQDQDEPSTRASRPHRPTGSVSPPAAGCGGRRPAGVGSDRAAAAHRWPSSPGGRPRCGPRAPRGPWSGDRSRREDSPTATMVRRVVPGEQLARRGLADGQARAADQHREQALDPAEGAGEGPAERTGRPHSAPRCSNWCSRNDRRCRPWQEPPSSDAVSGWSAGGHRTHSLPPPSQGAGVVRHRPWWSRAARPAPWARTPAAAADRQRYGWQPCPGRHRGTRHRSGPDRWFR